MMKRIEICAVNIIKVFMFVIMLYLTISSLFITADIPLNGGEKTIFISKVWPVTLAIMAIIGLSLYKFWNAIVKMDATVWSRRLIAYDFLLCILWMVIANTKEGADQAQILYASRQFAQGDFAKLSVDQYMGMFPYQLPLALLYEPFYKLFGDVTPFLWQLINAFIICACQYLIYCIVKEVVYKKEIINLLLVLQFFDLPLVLYVSFVYGTVIGLGMSLVAVYFFVRYLKREKHMYRDLFLSALFMGSACVIRTNYLIWLIALCSVISIFSMVKKKYKALLYIPIVIGIFIGGRQAVYEVYEARSGMEVPEGVPNSLYVAMGLSENDEKANGWYNGYTWDLYFDVGCDWNKAEEVGIAALQKQMRKFMNEPLYLITFMREKINSTWLSPDFQALWNNHHHGQEIAYAPVIYNLYTGELHTATQFILGNIQCFIYLCTLVCFIGYRKSIQLEQSILALVFIGGFLFHLFWETKAQYVIVYYVLLFPYAAAGIYYVLNSVNSILISGYSKKRK